MNILTEAEYREPVRRALRLVTIATWVTLVGCSVPEDPALVVLPYYERCLTDIERLEAMLENEEFSYEMRRLSPSRNFVRGYTLNGLLELKLESNQLKDAKQLIDTFLAACGPSGRLELELPPSFHMDALEALALSGPRGKYTNNEALSVQIEDSTLVVFH